MTTQCSVVKSFLALIARICISLIFIIAGFDKLIDFNQYVDIISSKGLPYPVLTMVLAIIFELGGGILVFLGLFTRFGAFLLFVFIIVVTYYFHSFWLFEGDEMVNNFHHFFKNLSMLGAMIYIMACGAGHLSFDGLIRKKCCQKKVETSSTQ